MNVRYIVMLAVSFALMGCQPDTKVLDAGKKVKAAFGFFAPKNLNDLRSRGQEVTEAQWRNTSASNEYLFGAGVGKIGNMGIVQPQQVIVLNQVATNIVEAGEK